MDKKVRRDKTIKIGRKSDKKNRWSLKSRKSKTPQSWAEGKSKSGINGIKNQGNFKKNSK